MAKKGKYVYDWPRPMVTVDAVVFCLSGGKARLLLIKRGADPFQGMWSIPGGFVDMDEELEDAVARELREETGLSCTGLRQMHTFGTIGRDPRGRQITVAYMAILQRPCKVTGGDDAAEARWFDIERLPDAMAFDHADVARLAIARLRKTAAYRRLRRTKL